MDCDGVWFSVWFTYRLYLSAYVSPCALIKCNKIKTIWDEADEDNNNNDNDDDVKRRQIKSTNREILGIVFNNNTDVYQADTRIDTCAQLHSSAVREKLNNVYACMHTNHSGWYILAKCLLVVSWRTGHCSLGLEFEAGWCSVDYRGCEEDQSRLSSAVIWGDY